MDILQRVVQCMLPARYLTWWNMSEWYDNQKKPNSNFRKLLQEQIEKANPRCNLSAEETKRLNKLETIADKL